jgi:hypothetical protein
LPPRVLFAALIVSCRCALPGTKPPAAGLRVGSQTLADLNLDQFRRYAEECVRMAQETPVTEHRTLLLEMAQRWIELAEQSGRLKPL